MNDTKNTYPAFHKNLMEYWKIATNLYPTQKERPLQHSSKTTVVELGDLFGKMNASPYVQSEAIQILLDNKADIHTKNNDGFTALMAVAYLQPKEIAELQLKNNADPNQKSNNGTTALQLAYENPHKGVVELLKKYSAK